MFTPRITLGLHHVYIYVYTMVTPLLIPCLHIWLELCLHHLNTMFTHMLQLCLHYKLFPQFPLYTLTEIKWGQVISLVGLTKVI